MIVYGTLFIKIGYVQLSFFNLKSNSSTCVINSSPSLVLALNILGTVIIITQPRLFFKPARLNGSLTYFQIISHHEQFVSYFQELRGSFFVNIYKCCKHIFSFYIQVRLISNCSYILAYLTLFVSSQGRKKPYFCQS